MKFPKKERLCSQTAIDKLFCQGQRLMVFPFSVRFIVTPVHNNPESAALSVCSTQPPIQVLINTSKRKFHHAVDRNRVKRLTRECYRLHKAPLFDYLQQQGLQMTLAINYIHNEILDYQTLFHKFDKLTVILLQQCADYPTH